MSILRNIITRFRKSLGLFKPYTVYPNSNIRYITEFKDGYALALFQDPKHPICPNILDIVILDTNYKISSNTGYKSFGYWNNGYLIAWDFNNNSDKNYVLLDKYLKEVQRYSLICDIPGYYLVHNNTPEGIKSGLLDENLQLILPISYSLISTVSKNRFFCSIGAKNIIFDAITKKTFDVTFTKAIYYESRNHWYKFKTMNYNMGYLDNDFNVVIEPKYQILGEFNKNGYAPFTRDGITGVIDITGKEFSR